MGEIEELLKEKTGLAAENRDTNIEELDKKLNEEKEKIVNLNDKINSESLLSKNNGFKESLDELSKIKKRFDETIKRLN